MKRLTRRTRLTMAILWPAFLMAGVLEMLTFAVVGPAELHGLGGAAIGWPAPAVHTVAFLIFWGAIATAGALSALLLTESDAVRRSEAAETPRGLSR